MQYIPFYKYQGTGNDFIMIDNRHAGIALAQPQIAEMCGRRFGIGADGLILLENDHAADFKMVYYNADGHESSMCGNGGRCVAAFANFLGIFKEECRFMAVDGPHDAKINDENIHLKMKDVREIGHDGNDFVLDTGSPHFVRFMENVKNIDVFHEGRNIRNAEKYRENGINVNFAENLGNGIFVRTYERGVEDETLSCGTGVTAAALSYLRDKNTSDVKVETLGGHLAVHAEKSDKGFKNIWLSGPAKQVYKGEILLK